MFLHLVEKLIKFWTYIFTTRDVACGTTTLQLATDPLWLGSCDTWRRLGISRSFAILINFSTIFTYWMSENRHSYVLTFVHYALTNFQLQLQCIIMPCYILDMYLTKKFIRKWYRYAITWVRSHRRQTDWIQRTRECAILCEIECILGWHLISQSCWYSSPLYYKVYKRPNKPYIYPLDYILLENNTV